MVVCLSTHSSSASRKTSSSSPSYPSTNERNLPINLRSLLVQSSVRLSDSSSIASISSRNPLRYSSIASILSTDDSFSSVKERSLSSISGRYVAFPSTRTTILIVSSLFSSLIIAILDSRYYITINPNIHNYHTKSREILYTNIHNNKLYHRIKKQKYSCIHNLNIYKNIGADF